MDPISLGVMTAVSIGSSVVGGVVSAKAAKDKGEAEASLAIAQGRATAESKEAEAESSDYLAAVARNNAIIAQQNKEYEESVSKQLSMFEREAGVAAAQEKMLETGQVIGKQRAGFAARGVDVNRGSPADVQESTRIIGDLDAATILSNTARKVWGYDVESTRKGMGFDVQRTGFENEATLRGMQSGAARRAGGIALTSGGEAAEGFERAGTTAAIGSLLGGASSVSDKWLTYKNKGVIG